MLVSCDILLEYDDEEQTKNIQQALAVDDFDFVISQVKGNKLSAHIESKSISSLLHTLDDYLACVSVAEKIVKKKTGKKI